MPEAEKTTMHVNMGPAHPAMHGTIHIGLELEGERVRGSEVEIGYLHRAFEKTVENRTWNQAIPYTDRLNYVSPVINNVGYALAVEKMMGIEVPERGVWIRMALCELSRVTDHLTCNGAMAMELGALTVFVWFIKAREILYGLLEEATGARLTVSWARIGGVTGDLTEKFLAGLPEAIKMTRQTVAEGNKLLVNNRIFIDRTRGIGALTRDEVVSHAITGPLGRASGLNYDVRRDLPYLAYDQVKFEVPLGVNGDVYDRFMVRVNEIEQSLRIIEQCLEKLPAGPVSADDQRVTLPAKTQVYTEMDPLIHHFKLLMPGHGIRPPAGEVYQAVEGANGELGFYIVSGGTDRPWRVRVRPPCFFPMSALSKMIEGGLVADVVPAFGSINMIAGELDR